jgi:hypothetical protein
MQPDDVLRRRGGTRQRCTITRIAQQPDASPETRIALTGIMEEKNSPIPAEWHPLPPRVRTPCDPVDRFRQLPDHTQGVRAGGDCDGSKRLKALHAGGVIA